MPNVFVSYSRRDFYAAEALTSVLAASGQVRTWLDVEQLRPGTDWESAINGAIDEADVVVVVASPAAMASRWVTEEWQRALRNGTPVHVALVRKTELPPELANVVVHDLRGRVFSEARRLVDVIWGQAEPRPSRRFAVSPQMALLWLALGFCTVIAGLGATLGWEISEFYRPVHAGKARIGLMLALANAVAVAGLIFLMVRLARRSVSSLHLWEGFFVATAVSLFSLIGILMMEGRPAWPHLTAAVVAVLGNVLVKRSRTVHLEMPTGVGEEHLRRRVKGQRARRRRWGAFGRRWAEYNQKLAALRQAMPGVGSPATYAVLCHEDDQPIADLIMHGCDTAGFQRDNVDPRWFFVVVTTRTAREVVRQAREVYGDRAVFVLGTSMRLQDDDELRRHQWLDFREQDPEGLHDFLRAVVAPGASDRGVVTVPMDADRFRAPLYVTGYVLFGRVVVGLVAAPALGMLTAGALSRAVPLLLVTAALGAALINLTRRTAARAINGVGWLLRAVLVFLLFIGWLFLAPNLPAIPPVNRVVIFVFVVLGLVAPLKALLGLWLPPVREGAAAVRAAARRTAAVRLIAITPPAYSFSLTLAPLVLASGYFFVTGA